MEVFIFDNRHFINSLWSGGSTKQLYIFPAQASYAERNFEVRLSTAKVEVNKSTFTQLAGVNRKLMILDGEINICHQNQYSKQLKPFDVDSFKGDWKTTSIGTCTDFNVMTTGNRKSKLFSLQISANNHSPIKLDKEWKSMFIYIVTGSLEIEIAEKKHMLNQGNLLVISIIDKFLFPLYTNKKCQLVVTTIN